MDRWQMQLYRSDRRKLLDFILSSTGLVKEVRPGSSSSGLDLDTISADHVITCVKSGGVLDVSEATRRFYLELDDPIMINSRLGTSYFLFSDPEASGSPPSRMPPDVKSEPSVYTSRSSNLFEHAPSYTRMCGDCEKDPYVQSGDNVNLPELRLPSLRTDV